MPPSRPFFDPQSGELDTDQLLEESIPLAKLVAVVGALALVPLLLQFLLGQLLGFVPIFGAMLSIAAQFVLAVGTGIVLLYLVVRAFQLVDES
ncbi:hypothetical protein [Natrinema gelatinilyticum]|uniref:hypothetical protein n=1 Tax=Natrinema gelatinilyticum TaxID=2961571 RepID=UPI0020C24DFB|nr:hypothetical protein [Natrinema gelatinilyticum]